MKYTLRRVFIFFFSAQHCLSNSRLSITYLNKYIGLHILHVLRLLLYQYFITNSQWDKLLAFIESVAVKWKREKSRDSLTPNKVIDLSFEDRRVIDIREDSFRLRVPKSKGGGEEAVTVTANTRVTQIHTVPM